MQRPPILDAIMHNNISNPHLKAVNKTRADSTCSEQAANVTAEGRGEYLEAVWENSPTWAIVSVLARQQFSHFALFHRCCQPPPLPVFPSLRRSISWVLAAATPATLATLVCPRWLDPEPVPSHGRSRIDHHIFGECLPSPRTAAMSASLRLVSR